MLCFQFPPFVNDQYTYSREAASTVESTGAIKKVNDWMKNMEDIDEKCSSPPNSYEISNAEMLNCIYNLPAYKNGQNQSLQPSEHVQLDTRTNESFGSNEADDLCDLERRSKVLLGMTCNDEVRMNNTNENQVNIGKLCVALAPIQQQVDLNHRALSSPTIRLSHLEIPKLSLVYVGENCRLFSTAGTTNMNTILEEESYVSHSIAYDSYALPELSVSNVSPSQSLDLIDKSSRLSSISDSTASNIAEGSYITHSIICDSDVTPEPSTTVSNILQSNSAVFNKGIDQPESAESSAVIPKLHDPGGSTLKNLLSERCCTTSLCSHNTVELPSTTTTCFSPHLQKKDSSLQGATDHTPMEDNYFKNNKVNTSTEIELQDFYKTVKVLTCTLPSHHYDGNLGHETPFANGQCTLQGAKLFDNFTEDVQPTALISPPLSLASSAAPQLISLSSRNTLQSDCILLLTEGKIQLVNKSAIFTMPHDDVNHSNFHPQINSTAVEKNQCSPVVHFCSPDTKEDGIYIPDDSALAGGTKDDFHSHLGQTQKTAVPLTNIHCGTESTGQYNLSNTAMISGGTMIDTTQTFCYLPHSLAGMEDSL